MPADAPALAPPDAIAQDFSHLLVGIRRHLHQNPEVGFREEATARFIREMLEMHGLEVHGPVAGTGQYVDVVGDLPGPMIAYRADIDALPIQDAKEAPYASCVPGVAHLCGHDAHTAVGIGTALLLHARRAQQHGTVRVFFQPNEEGVPSGAPVMIREGILEGVEAVYAIHVDPTLETGRYGVIAGPATAAADRFHVVVDGGDTGHSARPHLGVDTVWLAVNFSAALYQLAGRVTDARNPAVFTICRFEGGEAYNVIPAQVSFGGVLRSTDAGERELLLDHMRHLAHHLGALHGARIDVQIDRGAPPVLNDERLAANAEAAITALYGDEALVRLARPSMGSEDFAHYQQHVPGLLLRVGTARDAATRHPLHADLFDLDEAALAPAAHLTAGILTRHLDHDVLGSHL